MTAALTSWCTIKVMYRGYVAFSSLIRSGRVVGMSRCGLLSTKVSALIKPPDGTTDSKF